MDYKLRLLFVIFFPITTVADDRPITILRDLKLCFQNSGLPAFRPTHKLFGIRSYVIQIGSVSIYKLPVNQKSPK